MVARRLAELVAQKDWRLLEAGRFLHDDLGQLLTAAGIRLELIAHQTRSDDITLLQDLLEQCMSRVRSMSVDLNRSTADRLGLKPALERLLEKWKPALRASIRFSCPPQLKLSLLQSRAVVGMVEFGLELAANNIKCERIEVKAKLTTRKCVMTVHLFAMENPLSAPEAEVLWRILRASAALAGGTAEINVAFRSEDVTIMRVEFPTKPSTQLGKVKQDRGNEN